MVKKKSPKTKISTLMILNLAGEGGKCEIVEVGHRTMGSEDVFFNDCIIMLNS